MIEFQLDELLDDSKFYIGGYIIDQTSSARSFKCRRGSRTRGGSEVLSSYPHMTSQLPTQSWQAVQLLSIYYLQLWRLTVYSNFTSQLYECFGRWLNINWKHLKHDIDFRSKQYYKKKVIVLIINLQIINNLNEAKYKKLPL